MRIHRPRNRRRPDARVALLLGALGVFSSVTLPQHWRGHDSLLEEEPRTAPVEATRAVVTYLPSLRYTRDESKMRTDADCAPGILYLLSVRYLSDGRWFPALSLVRALQPNDATVHTQANAFAHTQVQRPGDAMTKASHGHSFACSPTLPALRAPTSAPTSPIEPYASRAAALLAALCAAF